MPQQREPPCAFFQTSDFSSLVADAAVTRALFRRTLRCSQIFWRIKSDRRSSTLGASLFLSSLMRMIESGITTITIPSEIATPACIRCSNALPRYTLFHQRTFVFVSDDPDMLESARNRRAAAHKANRQTPPTPQRTQTRAPTPLKINYESVQESGIRNHHPKGNTKAGRARAQRAASGALPHRRRPSPRPVRPVRQTAES